MTMKRVLGIKTISPQGKENEKRHFKNNDIWKIENRLTALADPRKMNPKLSMGKPESKPIYCKISKSSEIKGPGTKTKRIG